MWFRDGLDKEEELVEVKMQGGGGSIGIWSCINDQGVGCSKIYNGTIDSERYIEMIENELVPSSHLWFAEGEERHFQQDNARPHTSKVTTEAFKLNQIEVLG